MTISFRRFVGFVVVAVLLFIGAFAMTAYASHSWGPYHWARTANPFTLKLGDNVSTVWDTHLSTASTDWSISSVLDTLVVAGGSKRNCGPVKGRVEICNKTYGNNGWLGVASIWINGSHITQGTVKLNDTYFNTASYNTPAWRQFVMCQEIGHTFGLDHQDVNFYNTNLGTCMDYTNSPESNQHPNQHDYDELGLIYTHLDGSTTVTRSRGESSNGHAIDEEVTDDTDKVLRKDSKGRPALYERNLGKGEKLFTFIFWTE